MDDEQLAYILRAYENKLYELLPLEEYRKFIAETARRAFKVEDMLKHHLEFLIDIARQYRDEENKSEEDTED